LRLGLHLVEAASAVDGGRGPGAAQRRPLQEARAASPAGDDAASGRLAARLARGRTRARPDRDARRCDGGDLFGVPGRRGRHNLNLPGAQRGVLAAWPADEPAYGSRFARFPHDQGRRDRPRLSDPGRPGAGAIGRRAHRCFLTTGAGPFGARVRDPSDHLVKELRLAGITEVEAANAFIRDVYRPAHNARFAVEPAGESSAFTPIPGVDLDEILCVEEERQVGNDNCVSYRTLKLQLPGARCVPISSGRGSRSTSIPAVPTPSFTDHDASAATTRKAGSRTPSQSNAPLNSARRRACGNGTTLSRCPQSHRETKREEADKPRTTKTGQLHSLST
jgi:hypothetical protein